eukprot:scaffold1501_cov352-Pavlova_lutheri.AAC.1
MAASSTAEDHSVNCDLSSSVSFIAGTGIALRVPWRAPYFSKVLDRNSVVVPKGFDLPGTRAGAASTVSFAGRNCDSFSERSSGKDLSVEKAVDPQYTKQHCSISVSLRIE